MSSRGRATARTERIGAVRFVRRVAPVAKKCGLTEKFARDTRPEGTLFTHMLLVDPWHRPPYALRQLIGKRPTSTDPLHAPEQAPIECVFRRFNANGPRSTGRA